MNTVKYIYEEKQGKKHIQTYECVNPETVYNDLAHELINKKINCCTWIRSIRREPLYNGYQKITVTYDHGGRRIYTVSDH